MSSKEGLRSRKAGAAEDKKRFADTADAAQATHSPKRSPSRRDSKGKQTTEAGAGLLDALTVFFSKVSVTITRWVRGKPKAPEVPPTPGTRAALELLDATAATSFDSNNADHEAMLLELWTLLQPDVPFERKSKNWSDIGFQGKDPATDFRGQGMLGLRNLFYYSRTQTEQARDILLRPHIGFPLALAAINISSFLTKLLKQHAGLIGNPLFERAISSDEILNTFNVLFGLVFADFEAAYSVAIGEYLDGGGNPAFTIMQFNPIREKFFNALTDQVNLGKFEQTLVEQCKTRVADGE